MGQKQFSDRFSVNPFDFLEPLQDRQLLGTGRFALSAGCAKVQFVQVYYPIVPHQTVVEAFLALEHQVVVRFDIFIDLDSLGAIFAVLATSAKTVERILHMLLHLLEIYLPCGTEILPGPYRTSKIIDVAETNKRSGDF